MKFSLVSISSLVFFSLAVSASPLEKRIDSTTPSASSNATIVVTPSTATTSDSMNGAKATASISIIGTQPTSGATSMLSYTSMAVIVPVAIAAALSMA